MNKHKSMLMLQFVAVEPIIETLNTTGSILHYNQTVEQLQSLGVKTPKFINNNSSICVILFSVNVAHRVIQPSFIF